MGGCLGPSASEHSSGTERGRGEGDEDGDGDGDPRGVPGPGSCVSSAGEKKGWGGGRGNGTGLCGAPHQRPLTLLQQDGVRQRALVRGAELCGAGDSGGTGGWHRGLAPAAGPGAGSGPALPRPGTRRHPARPRGPPLPSRARLSRHARGRWRDRPGRLSRAVALGAAPSPAQAAAGTRRGRRVGVRSRGCGPWGSTAGCSHWGVLGCSREGASTMDEDLGRVHKGAVAGECIGVNSPWGGHSGVPAPRMAFWGAAMRCLHQERGFGVHPRGKAYRGAFGVPVWEIGVHSVGHDPWGRGGSKQPVGTRVGVHPGGALRGARSRDGASGSTQMRQFLTPP